VANQFRHQSTSSSVPFCCTTMCCASLTVR
jgi:hypothetical protein